jgi:hypothetical protein
MSWSDEAFKAFLTALATTVVAQIASSFETLTDPNSPKKVLDEGQRTVALVDSWAKASEALQHLPTGEVRDAAQERLDEIIRTLSQRQLLYSRVREQRRSQLLALLAVFRFAKPGGWLKGLSAFLFYLFVILFLQSVRMASRGDTDFHWGVMPLFAAMASLFWLLSSPKK